jgi:hypothetical protein
MRLKSKIRYNGKVYSSRAELPPDVRMAYEQALHQRTAKKRFTINGQKFASDDAMPSDIRKLCEDVMSVIETNGEVTIPKKEPLLTKKEVAIVAAFGAGILALILARVASG